MKTTIGSLVFMSLWARHLMWVCFRAVPMILYTSCSWRKWVKPLRNYKIGMVMLFFLANYLEGRYLHKSHSRHPSKKKFNVLDNNVYISPDKIVETFVEFDDDLIMGNDSYSKCLKLAWVFVSLDFRLIDFCLAVPIEKVLGLPFVIFHWKSMSKAISLNDYFLQNCSFLLTFR